MSGSLLLVLPGGRSAEVDEPLARLICDRLWALGIRAGAALAAARITEALRQHRVFGQSVAFDEREMAPLLEVCDELVETFEADEDQKKVAALLADVEALRESIRAGR